MADAESSVPLRGREGERADITAALDGARRGARSAVVIVGPGGTGKTCLLRAALAEASRGWTYLATVLDGADLGTDVPFPAVPPDVLGSAASNGRDVSRLVVVDNAHLVDPERLKSLASTALADRSHGALLMVAGRPGRCGVTTEWSCCRTSTDSVIIRLGPLGASAVRDMLTDLTGSPPHDVLATFVEQADGNPLLVRELVTGLREEHRLRVIDGITHVTGTHLPDRVIVLISQRLDQLSPRCRQLLQIASVLGRTLHLSLISSALREPTASTLPLLEEALAAEILDVRDERLLFQSTLVWRAVRGTMPAPIRLALEQEFGALAGVPGQEDGPDPQPPPVTATSDLLDRLTARERAIAKMVSTGLTNREIAARVYLSPHTVNYYLRRIFRKLDVASRIELAMLAKSEGD